MLTACCPLVSLLARSLTDNKFTQFLQKTFASSTPVSCPQTIPLLQSSLHSDRGGLNTANGLQLLPPLWPLRSLRGQALSRRLAIGQWREVAGQSSPKLNSPRNIHADLPLIAAIPLKNELIDLKMLPSVCSCGVFYCMTVLKKLIALILVLFWQDRGVRVTYG